MTTQTIATLGLDEVLIAAETAFESWSAVPSAGRARHLEAMAAAMEVHADELIQLAIAETHLPFARLRGELTRTVFQLRFFAEELRGGRFVDARIDHSDPEWPMGAPRPDLRRMLLPLGPVLVFAASNFPFAFSVGGGDTASALAAGCPVIVKAHHGHPELSARTAAIFLDALEESGAPAGVLALIHGTETGIQALKDPRIQAGAFTGGIPGGRALFDIAQQRDVPIPFFAEMGSNNPVFVTPGAAAERPAALAEGYLAAVTGSAGQLCTKPGTLFVPAGSQIIEHVRTAELPSATRLLTERIEAGYSREVAELADHRKVRVLSGNIPSESAGPTPLILATDIAAVLENPDLFLAERFGPFSLVVEYEDMNQLLMVARRLDGQLTATVQATDQCDVHQLLRVLAGKAGRVLWNSWPTGVSVTHAQQHGGPYPASTAVQTTSVGTAAIQRFLRPVALQGFPDHLLPPELKDSNPFEVPRHLG
ncbi:aldehyde dehydrogenase (NADP(+)) [Arthrobacter sp. FW306-05-C]|uniref:aldehyde dehydrogenase (NADP(+)) n=1 Tax=unclassified Arthrobacter TaxID=235627 RepID=UPI001EF0F06C|nr:MULTISPECIES: aldehyde dehydrogenase (NADP(+)) [unclassified Arthrobacter]UKA68478.1 aldehyde dehydrogenase (NADP(+)) [Arthrobacter sp. FW306-05-C]UKA77170.1 aldehyde dehydrogenase (NADP(+)) [Arthrobacter sp. FW306-07-I]